MSDRCQYTQNCEESAFYECPCENPAVLICKSHLDYHIQTPSEKGHRINPIIISISEKSRSCVVTEIIKLKLVIWQEKKNYIGQIQNLIREIHENCLKDLKTLDDLSKDLDSLIELVLTTNEVSLKNKNSEVLEIFKHHPDKLAENFSQLDLISLKTEVLNNKIVLVVKENLTRNLQKIVSKSDSSLEIIGICKKGHELKLSIDVSKFYEFMNGGVTITSCDLCRAQIVSNNLHCRRCLYDVCEKCSKSLNYQIPDWLKCPKEHILGYVSSASEIGLPVVTCDNCGINYTSSGWRCFECDYDVCVFCAFNKGIVSPFQYPFLCPYQHEVIVVPPMDNRECLVCRNKILVEYWYCQKCSFMLCNECGTNLGFKVPKCEYSHFFVTYQTSGNKISKLFSSAKCKTCNSKISSGDWACPSCKIYLCKICFLTFPHKYLTY